LTKIKVDKFIFLFWEFFFAVNKESSSHFNNFVVLFITFYLLFDFVSYNS